MIFSDSVIKDGEIQKPVVRVIDQQNGTVLA